MHDYSKKMRELFSSGKLRHLASMMAGVWIAFILLAAFQPCSAVEAAPRNALQTQHAGHHDAQVPDDDVCCHAQISSHDVFHNLSMNSNGTGHFKPALPSLSSGSFLLPASTGRPATSPVLGEPPPPRSNPFLSTIRLLI